MVCAVAFDSLLASAAAEQTAPAPAAVSVLGAAPYPCCVKAHVDADGTARVGYLTGLYYGARTVLWAAEGGAGQPLGRARPLLRLGVLRKNVEGGYPVFAWDDRGRAIVTWDRYIAVPETTARRRVVFVTVQRPDGRWSRVRQLSGPRGDARSPSLAINASGEAIIGWEVQTRGGWHVEAALRPAGAGHFGRPRVLSATTRGARAPIVAIAPRGSVLVAWRQRHRVMAARGSVTAAFERRLVLGHSSSAEDLMDAEDVDLAIGADRTAAVVRRDEVDPGDELRQFQVRAAIIPPAGLAHSGPLGPPVPGELEDVGPVGGAQIQAGPQAAVSALGETIVAVPRAAGHAYLGVFTATAAAPSWSAPQPVGVWESDDATMETASDGSVLLTWAEGTPDAATVVVAVRRSGGIFGAPIRVAPAVGLWPSAAAGAGFCVVAWLDLRAAVLPTP